MPGKMTKAKLAQMNEAVHAAHLRALIARRAAEVIETKYRQAFRLFYDTASGGGIDDC